MKRLSESHLNLDYETEISTDQESKYLTTNNGARRSSLSVLEVGNSILDNTKVNCRYI